MAEVLAVAGLAYIGKMLSNKPVAPNLTEAGPVEVPPPVSDIVPESPNINSLMEARKTEIANFGVIAPQGRSSGSELLDMRSRMFDNGRMNNLSPVEKQLIGPGLGVDPNTPAFGGYQQLLRINPENVGAYRLTTLPGRTGPAADITGGRQTLASELGHNRPERTAALWERRPETAGRAQGMSGVVPRNEHEQTKRLTNRSITGSREDGLNFSGAKRIVSEGTRSQDPTRNKKDGNIEQYIHNNQPAPNINSFAHGYLNSPATKIGEKRTYATPHTVEQLKQYGFRPDDRRGKANRAGNAGRMNVRAGPLNQGGMPTAARIDTTRIDGRLQPVNGTSMQQYINKSFYQQNAYKGNINPNASDASLNIARKQMESNPIAQTYY